MTIKQIEELKEQLKNIRHAFVELLDRKLAIQIQIELDPELEHNQEIIDIRTGMAKLDKDLSAQIVALKKRIDDGFKTKFVSKVSFGEIIPRKPPEEDDDPQLTNSAAPRDVLFHQN